MTISNLPPIPSRNDDPQNFRSEANVFVAALQAFIDETNVFADGVNEAKVSTDLSKASSASSETTASTKAQDSSSAANFKGEWSGKTGAANIPYAVSHNSEIWVLKSSIADVTASEPSDSNTEWANFNSYSVLRKPFPIAPLDGATSVVPTVTLEASAYAPSVSIDARLYRRFEVTTPSDTTFASPVFTSDVDADTASVGSSLSLITSYIWRCKDVSSLNESPWMDIQGFTTADRYVVAPSLTVEGSPASVTEEPTLTGSAFTTVPASGDTHLNTDWQVLDGITVVYESLADTTNLLSIVVPSGNLEVDTEYTFKVRYRGNSFGVSDYGSAVATTEETFDIIPLLAVGYEATPNLTVYNQEVDTFTKVTDPATLPSTRARGLDFSYSNVYLAVGTLSSPYVYIYKRSIGSAVFTKLANPSTLPTGEGTGISFSGDSTYLAVAHKTSPYVTIYKRSGDTFTKLANPATLPTNHGYGVSFSGDDTYLAVSHAITPYVTIYKRSGDTFTKLANPSSLPTSHALGVSFSSDSTYLAVAHQASPYVTIYKRSGDTFTKLANPSTLPTGNGYGVSFSSDGVYLSVGHRTSPYVTIYKRSGDVFTKLANPASLPAGDANGVSFSSDSVYLSVAHASSPYITIYKRSGDVFTKLANPSSLPTSTAFDVAFSK